ncbi:Tfp pilus assembly protein FimT/FimU [Candidatus Riflebacteria bacterium]
MKILSGKSKTRHRGVTIIELLIVVMIMGVIAAAGSAKVTGLLSYSEIRVEEELFRNTLRYARSQAISNRRDAWVQLYWQRSASMPSGVARYYGGYKVILSGQTKDQNDVSTSAEKQYPYFKDQEHITNIIINPTPGVRNVRRNFNPRLQMRMGSKMVEDGVRNNVYIEQHPYLTTKKGSHVNRIVFNKFGQLVFPRPADISPRELTVTLRSFDNEEGKVRIDKFGGRVK